MEITKIILYHTVYQQYTSNNIFHIKIHAIKTTPNYIRAHACNETHLFLKVGDGLQLLYSHASL